MSIEAIENALNSGDVWDEWCDRENQIMDFIDRRGDGDADSFPDFKKELEELRAAMNDAVNTFGDVFILGLVDLYPESAINAEFAEQYAIDTCVIPSDSGGGRAWLADYVDWGAAAGWIRDFLLEPVMVGDEMYYVSW